VGRKGDKSQKKRRTTIINSFVRAPKREREKERKKKNEKGEKIFPASSCLVLGILPRGRQKGRGGGGKRGETRSEAFSQL